PPPPPVPPPPPSRRRLCPPVYLAGATALLGLTEQVPPSPLACPSEDAMARKKTAGAATGAEPAPRARGHRSLVTKRDLRAYRRRLEGELAGREEVGRAACRG